MTAYYYNEIDPYAAQWLRNLIAAGHLPAGDVDERSIEDVRPDDIAGYTQCHFFAGIGGWPHALALAGWPVDRPVWTGSCPCQPFSAAGKGAGFADERHLWPSWQHLIAQCRPPVVFGEQVASKAVGPWIDLVHADLEGMGYAFGCVPFPSAGIGAPHIRDRVYWVAHATGSGRGQTGRDAAGHREAGNRWPGNRIGDAGAHGLGPRLDSGALPMGGRLANAECDGLHRARGDEAEPSGDRQADGLLVGSGEGLCGADRPGPSNDFWADADWLLCRDGKWRPVEPGTFPLAHGIPGRVGRLRAYGNAIVPQAAAAFVESYLDIEASESEVEAA